MPVHKLTNEVASWETQVVALKMSRGNLSSKLKEIEDKFLADEHVTKILGWIKKEEDPE